MSKTPNYNYKFTFAYLLIILLIGIGVYRVEQTALEVKELAETRALVLCENQNELRSLMLTLVKAAPPPILDIDDVSQELEERAASYDSFRELAESVLSQQECPPDVEG